jgi:hypothetical protein
MEYVRPYLYPKQHDAFFVPIRYVLTEASTKSGKTVGAIAWILEQAFAGKDNMNYWWVAPIAPQADIAFRRIKANLTVGSFVARESPTPTIRLITGATISFKSADNPDSLFGEDVFAAVVDEASRCKAESWHALRSTLTATGGPVRIIGNVKGRKNWFYDLSRLAQSEMANNPNSNMKYVKITVLDAIEAGVIPQSELEDARRTLPENVFKELYMAEPSDDSGNPFGLDHIAKCTVNRLSEKPAVAFGIDLAKKHDYLVVIGLDEDGFVCVFQRWNNIPWRESIKRIWDIIGEDVPALVDSTGIGDPILEELQVGHGNFVGYHFSPLSKQRLMEGLAVSIQGQEIHFPSGVIRSELESFEYELTRTGVRYTAPEGLFDDCVCSLALAREQLSTTAPGANLMEFYAGEAKRAQAMSESDITIPEQGIGREFARALLTKEEIFDNELTNLYNETMKQYEPQATKCARCGVEIKGPTRVSDGFSVWHPECTIRGGRLAA